MAGFCKSSASHEAPATDYVTLRGQDCDGNEVTFRVIPNSAVNTIPVKGAVQEVAICGGAACFQLIYTDEGTVSLIGVAALNVDFLVRRKTIFNSCSNLIMSTALEYRRKCCPEQPWLSSPNPLAPVASPLNC